MSKPKTDTYDVIYSRIRRITNLSTPEGEIRFTATMKLIYAYIWTFQENKNRGNDDPIHTNTNVIAWEVGVSEKTAIDALKALDTAKVVRKATVKVRGNVNSSNYVAISPAAVVARGVTPPHPDEVKSKPKSKKTAAQPDGAKPKTQPKIEENKGDGESVQGNSGKRDGVSGVPDGGNAPLSSGGDALNGGNVVGIPWIANSFTPLGPLVPEARRWAQSQGATTWQDEIKLVWKLTGKTNMDEPGEHMRPDDVPAPEPAKQQASGYAPQLDYDEDQPF